jgi:hypothetical protein
MGPARRSGMAAELKRVKREVECYRANETERLGREGVEEEKKELEISKEVGKPSSALTERFRTHFLFVLMWPTWPQLAHLRWVPADLEDPGAPSAGESPDGRRTPFCFSRAKRRSLLRLRRLSSCSILPHVRGGFGGGYRRKRRGRV